MKKKIYARLSLITIITVLLTTITILVVNYTAFNKQTSTSLQQQGDLIAYNLNDTHLDTQSYLENLSKQLKDLHITLIEPDGMAIYDSIADTKGSTNYATNPEIIMAQTGGTGSNISKSSQSLNYDIHSYAKLLDNSNIVRVAVKENNLSTLFKQALPIIFLIIVIIFILNIFITFNLTKTLISPIEKLSKYPDDQKNSPVYDELAPLINKIHRQEQQIENQYLRLQEEKNIFQSITDNMREGLILIDSSKNIISINKSAINLLGNPAKNYTGQNLFALVRSVDIINAVQEGLAGKSTSIIQRIDNKYYNLFINTTFSNQKISGVVLLLVDVTKQQKTEKMRHDFTANVSHELKTPLTSIYGFAQMLEEDMVKSSEDRQKFAKCISKESTRLLSIIEDIMALSQIEDAKEKQLEKVDVHKTAKDVIESLTPFAEQKSIDLTLEGGKTICYANPHLLYELIYNLVENAIKYNHPQGFVKIKLAQDPQKISIYVEDNGIGITETDQKRIFERFYRADKSRSKETGGTGLGLSIVKHIAEYHGGSVELISTLNKGSTFRVFLPLS